MLCVLIRIASSDFSKGLKNEIETAVVNEPSVCEPLKVYCSNLRESAQFKCFPYISEGNTRGNDSFGICCFSSVLVMNTRILCPLNGQVSTCLKCLIRVYSHFKNNNGRDIGRSRRYIVRNTESLILPVFQ